VLVKATEGLTYVSPNFESQAAATVESGKLLGLYHFARSHPAKEADVFVRICGDYIGKALLVLDWEATDALSKGPAAALDFLERVYTLTGVRPLVYLSLSEENASNWSPVVEANYGLWLAQYNRESVVEGYRHRDLYGHLVHWPEPAMFQYTSVGRLSGYSGNLDLNIFYGTGAAWKAYAKASRTPVATTAPASSHAKTGAKKATGTWIAQTGTFTLGAGQNIRLRTAPNNKSSIIAMLHGGQVVRYNAYMYADGFVWIRQKRGDGYGYISTGTASGTKRTSSWGTFK
jgi:lysozyme